MAEDGKIIELTATAGPRAVPGAAGARLARGQGLGRYMILELLGQGGMGMVYAAYDPDLDRRVALKLLRHEGASSRSARGRLLREARAMAKLHHPNVVTVYEVGTVGDEDFVAMQYVDGANLSEWLRSATQRASRAQVLASFVQAGRGLAAAHREGLVHRDFKPTNVLVDAEGRVRVTDFGLVQGAEEPAPDDDAPVGAAPSLDGLTRTGATLGTPAYMAPEQYLAGEIDERTDQFSFCVALYEALYGERPFAGDDYEQLRAAVTGGRVRDEPEGADVPSWLRRILLRGLSVDREARFDSMDELLAALGRDPAVARRRWLAVALVAVALAGGLAVALRGGAAPEQGAMCRDSSAQLAGVWDDGARQRVRESFVRARVPDATIERAYAGFAGALDGYADAWVAMHAASCRATYVERTQSEDDFHLRGNCLREKRDELAALAEVFSRADEEAVEQAVQAARGLSRLDDCADLQALRVGFAPPTDDQHAGVAALRVALNEIKALDEAGQKGRALALAQDSLRTARELGYRPILAEALLWSGRVHFGLDHASEARAALEEAILVAEEAGHARVRAEALVLMTGVAANFSSRVEEARLWARRASAAIRNDGGDRSLEGRLNLFLASTYVQERAYDEALELFEQTRALYHSLGDREKQAQTMVERAEVHIRRKRYREALEQYREALVILEDELGRDHPRVALAMEGFAVSLRAVGSYDTAREYFGRAADYWRTERGRAWLDDHAKHAGDAGGRVIRGRVTNARGEPVEKAEVVVGRHLVADGRYLFASQGGQGDRKLALARAVTGPDGRFEIADASTSDLVIAAEHWEGGRARSRLVAAGTGTAKVDLEVAPTGSIRGRVVVGDRLAIGWAVVLSQRFRSVVRNQVVVTVGDDGTYQAENVAVGTWDLVLVDDAGKDEQSVTLQRKVEISAGKQTVADIEAAIGEIALVTSVRGKGGARIESAQVLLVRGRLEASTGGELQKKLLTALPRGGVKALYVAHGQERSFTALTPGLYTVCVLPFAGDYRDPDFMAKLAQRVFSLPVSCAPVDVLSGKREQRYVAEVAPTLPLSD